MKQTIMLIFFRFTLAYGLQVNQWEVVVQKRDPAAIVVVLARAVQVNELFDRHVPQLLAGVLGSARRRVRVLWRLCTHGSHRRHANQCVCLRGASELGSYESRNLSPNRH